MPTATQTETFEERDLVQLLRARGQRATSQRLVILRELRRRRVHATAEEILSAVKHELPGTSTPTVYATLELLVELGLARKIDAGLGVALYDGRTDSHQHMVCSECGRVYDLDGDYDFKALLAAAQRAGFGPDRVEVVVKGRCPDCGPNSATSR
jgi:Fe2+ or Zn2+ uptake regulation protein